MFRLLGFAVGSALSIVAIVLFLGTPEFHLGDDPADAERYDAAIRKLKEKQHVAEPEPAVTVAAAPGDDATPPPVDPAEPPADATAPAAAETLPAPPPAEPEWQAIWNPFRSRVAAEGFVHQLEKVTGLDYRVVRVRTGVYQAAFSYSDDAERQAKLERIARATGLELGDGT